MGKTKIEYADEVSNPLRALDTETGEKGTFCEKPDLEGTCKHCWAEVLNKRWGNRLAYDRSNRDRIEWEISVKELVRLSGLNARRPISAKFPGHPLVIFTNDTYDLFQPSITDELRNWIFDDYDKFTNLTLLIQTTYVSRMASYLSMRYPHGMPRQYFVGMSAGTQKFLDDNVHHLLRIPAQRRYVIFEPLLEAVHIHPLTFAHESVGVTNIHMAIVGGESGSSRRPFNPDWARSIRKECAITGTSFFFKQIDKVQPIPADLVIREFPRA